MLVIILAFALVSLKMLFLHRINLRCKVFGAELKKCLIKHFGDLFKGTKMICSAKH